MSAPKTNLDKQARRHSPALIGIGGGLAVAAVLFLIYLVLVTDPDTSLVEDDAVPPGDVVQTEGIEGPIVSSDAPE